MWSIVLLPEVSEWPLEQDDDTYVQIQAALVVLADIGPQLGRPRVDTVSGSTLKNLKELRPGSSRSSEVRLLFVFDPRRQAVFLVAGDKSTSYSTWYRQNIPLAEARYTLYLKGISDD